MNKAEQKNALTQTDKYSTDLTGKIVIVTGANSGIGKEVAKILSKNGCTLILGCRCESKGLATEKEIRSISGNDKVFFKHLDLVSFKSTASFVEQILKHISSTNDELYCIINNAGIFYNKHELTEDGFNNSLQINYLSPLYLTLLLLPTLRKSSHARIINLSSEAHKIPVEINVEKFFSSECFKSPNSFDPLLVYGETKLYILLSSFHLAKLLEGTGVTINCIDPGNVNTNIVRYFKEYNTFIKRFLIWLLFKTASKAAAEVVNLVLNPAFKEINGKFWKSMQEESPSSLALSPEVALTLWNKTLSAIPETDEKFVEEI